MRNDRPKAARQRWLECVTQTLYLRPFTERDATSAVLDWRSCILFLQSIMHYDVHVGVTTALALFGHVHYLPMTYRGAIHVFGEAYPVRLTRLSIQDRAQSVTAINTAFDWLVE